MQVGEQVNEKNESVEFLISGSRDKTLMIWDIVEKKEQDEDKEWGHPKKVLKGHSHFISDLTLS